MRHLKWPNIQIIDTFWPRIWGLCSTCCRPHFHKAYLLQRFTDFSCYRRAWDTLVYPRHRRFLLKSNVLPMMCTQEANCDIWLVDYKYIFWMRITMLISFFIYWVSLLCINCSCWMSLSNLLSSSSITLCLLFLLIKLRLLFDLLYYLNYW